MNKEFRAYFAELGTFYDVTEESDFTLEFGNKKPILHMHCSDGVFESFEVDVLQFTGLLDKNGVKIFEGDVLTPFHYKHMKTDNCVVTLKKGMFCFELNGKLIQETRPLYKSLNIAKTAGNDYEIVGNIYESPELIKDTK